MASVPRVSGVPLRSLARLARTSLGAAALYRVLRSELHIDALSALPDGLRGDVPLDTRALQGRPPRSAHDAGLPPPPPPWSATTDAYTTAYRSGASAVDVVARALALARGLSERSPSIGPLLEYAAEDARAEAEASVARYRAGVPRGPLDGVPFAVKEQTSVRGFARRAGTSYVDGAPRARDASCVERLRDAGAIVIGTTPMTEWGMTPTGANAKRTMPKNPHDEGCIAGGSSTGSGVAVATGLVPFALGADGGGSIRIPSALNGVFGIKATWGRVSREGDAATGSVAHLGPLAGSTLDLARVLEVIAFADPKDPETLGAPPVAPGSLVRAVGRGVRALRIGVDKDEWAAATPAVAKACEEALKALEREGAVIVPLTLALARYAPSIGYLSIGVESLAALRADWRDHADEMSADLRISFSALREVTAADYTDAQRLRAGLRREVALAFEGIDLLASPSTVSTAARATAAQMRSGFLDAGVLDGLCRFMFLGNLTGLPAISIPVGSDAGGLPVGFQLMGDAWDEATVLAASAHLERVGVATVRRPKVAVEPWRA